MIDFVKSLGWFIRFVPSSETSLSAFYKDVLGFPFVRAGDAQAVDFFWAGEALIFEIIFEGRMQHMPSEESDPNKAPLLPIYRVSDIHGIAANLKAKAVPVTEIQALGNAEECFITDPIGCLVGLRQVHDDSTLPQDIEAKRRAHRGEAFNPGCAPMPADWQELGWIVRRVADVNAMKGFYTRVLGLPLVYEYQGRAVLDLGDNTLLELAPGGSVRNPPTNRAELPATMILRIQSIDAFKQQMRRHNVRIVHDVIQWTRGSLSYIADPEGNLIGVEEKYHPSDYMGHAPFPEDLEAQRRWNERLAARRLIADSKAVG